MLESARRAVAKAASPAVAAYRRHPRVALYVLAFAVHVLVAPFLIHDWDGFVFITTARDMLAGQSPYETVELEPSYIFVGDGVPVTNSWYAYPPVALLLMTPFYGLFTLIMGHAPWVERLGIKVPFILGDLALAFVAAGLVRTVLDGNEHAERRARLVERVILFNPFLIFISAAWGMFDAWMMALLIASIWALEARRPAVAGAAFALAVLVKPFPVLVLPLVAAFALRRVGLQGAYRWAGAGIATGLLVCLPFFLTSPQGFLQQVVFNHTGRPPQGFTLIGIPLAFGWINDLIGTSLPTGITPEALSRWSFFLLVFVLALVWLQALTLRTAREVVVLSLAAFAGMLLVSKVVNEQYFVMPVTMAAVAFSLTDRPLHLWVRRLYTVGGVVSGLLLGYHFFTFLPVDVAEALFPYDPLSAVPRLTQALGWNGEQAFVYPTLIAAASLVPALVLSIRLVVGQVAAPLRGLTQISLRRPRVPPATIALLLVLLLLAPASGAILAATPVNDPTAGFVPPEGKIVGAYYYLWWHNPAHDPDTLYGNWRQGVTHTPQDGYYTTSAGKMRNDFRAMKEAGIDLVVYSYHAHDKPKLPALVRLAGETGVTTAPMIELTALLDDPSHRPRDANETARPDAWGLAMRDETRDAIVRAILDPLEDFSHFETWWRMDDKPVVFLRPTQAVFYDATGPTRDRLVDLALALATDDARAQRAPAAPSRAQLERDVPLTPDELRQPGTALWRRAYHELAREFWASVSDEVAKRQRPVYLVGALTWDPEHGADRGASLGLARLGALDASFISSPSDLWQAHLGRAYGSQAQLWEDAFLIQAQAQRGTSRPIFATVTPGHDDRVLRPREGFVLPYEDNGTFTYDRMWTHALALQPDVLLIESWNNFRAGNGIEPTHELGDRFLQQTKEHAERWKAQGARQDASLLLITNYLGASYHNDSGDPDGSYGLSLQLARAAERVAPGRVAAVDWNGPDLARVDLTQFDLVVIEPGSKWPWTAAAQSFIGRVHDRAREGGAILLLGSDVGVHFAKLTTWTEPPLHSLDLRVETPQGEFAIRADSWTALHHTPSNATTLLWMTDGRSRMPALWEIPWGDGTIAVTAFRPQRSDIDPQLFGIFIERAQAHREAR